MEAPLPGLPLPKKLKRIHSAGKVMASIFCDSQEVIMIDYRDQGRTINGAYWRRGKLTNGVLLLQDNTPAHTSQVVMTAGDYMWI